jgi:hypothetical protein
VILATMAFAGLCVPRQAMGYSVLAHEANIDALWDPTITTMLRARFPEATDELLEQARAYAYGGCVIQDLGYYPFGSHFFSNLLHYVRTGDFVNALIRDAQDVNEYAFALGALGHYAADNRGHPMAVNRAVPLMYPKLRAEFGNNVTYVQSPKSHVLVEFSFDVVQVAAGAYAPEAYHSHIGFKVAKPALERAFRDTYGIEMKNVSFSEDLAIATYRHAVGTTILEMTKVAWSKKRDQIMRVTPGMQRKKFVFKLSRKQYDEQFGSDYAKPHGFAGFIAVVYNLVPKIGPFRSLSFSVPTPEAERLFLESFTSTREHFRQSLDALQDGRLRLPNTDFDTGQPTARGEYSLADVTYDELLDKLADRGFADVPEALSANMVAYYGAADPLPGAPPDQLKRATKSRLQLALLKATLVAPSNQNSPVGIGGRLTEATALVASDTVPLAHPDQDGPQEKKAEAPEDKPPTPKHAGFRAVLEGLHDDIKHLPSKQNLYVAGIGGGLALGTHPFDRTVNARVLNQYDIVNKVFAPAKYYGDTPEQMGLSIGTWVLGRVLNKPKVAHLGMDLLRAQAVTEILVEPIKFATQRARPDGSDRQSFPSGHAAITFAAATVIERHLGWKHSIAAYVIASYVATSRLHDNRHYLSDIVFGAAVGSIAGRTVTAHGRETWTLGPMAVPGGVAIGATRTRF